MRVRRLTNWYPPSGAGCIVVGDVHEIDDETGRHQLACGDVELAAKATITPLETPDMHVDTDSAQTSSIAASAPVVQPDTDAARPKKGKRGHAPVPSAEDDDEQPDVGR